MERLKLESFPSSIFPISFRTFHFIVLSDCPFKLHVSQQLACRLEIPGVGRSPQNSIQEVKRRRSIKIFHSFILNECKLKSLLNSFHLTSTREIDQEAYQGSKYFAIMPRGLKIISRSARAEFPFVSILK